ncbi:MAG TPA: hypothetical protein VE398_17270 [Acidobacteriota bacterium]|nr:hypothetical protein [Acidobacteriota bacterium]
MRVDCLYMLLILLLPLIPAFVLFRFLPSTADVTGPFKGLTLKLGGAFAGYFVTVLLSWQVAKSMAEPTWSDNWNVVAQITFDGPQAAHPPASQAVVLVKPPTADIDSNGQLQMMVPVPRVHNGAVDLQRLIVAFDGYETVNIPLDPDRKHLGLFGRQDFQVTFDDENHRILIGKPIVLTRASQ